MAMDREISRIRIGNQNKHAGKSGKNQRLNPNEKYINKISRIQVIFIRMMSFGVILIIFISSGTG